MFPPMPLVAVDPSDEFEREILREFDFMDFDFARQFNFSRVFEGGGDRSVGSFDSNAVSVEYSHDDAARGGYRCRQHRRQRCSNRMYRIESVKTSCWYREFLWPGPVRELTYELSLRDRYSEFCDFFRMPLSKVDELVDIFPTGLYSNAEVSVSTWGVSRARRAARDGCTTYFSEGGYIQKLSHFDAYIYVGGAKVLLQVS